jgi:hypothetical protein
MGWLRLVHRSVGVIPGMTAAVLLLDGGYNAR